MPRSEITIDLGAVRRNARVLLGALAGAELWAVVKADGYGHGAVDVGGAALGAGATALCIATVAEALAVRTVLRDARIIVLGPVAEEELGEARDARLELVVGDDRPLPEGIPVHLKLDTGMGRWGLSELPTPSRQVVGLMSHLATAGSDAAFAELQIERFREATDAYSSLTRHMANSAATLRLPSARFDAGRCGIALYGLSPFGGDPTDDGLEPVLGWRSEIVRVKLLEVGESTGYGRRFVAERPTWIGHRAGRLRGRLPARPHRHLGPGRRRPADGRRGDLDGLLRRGAPRAAGAGDTRDLDRRRGARRRPCPGRGDDLLRARLRHRLAPDASAAVARRRCLAST